VLEPSEAEIRLDLKRRPFRLERVVMFCKEPHKPSTAILLSFRPANDNSPMPRDFLSKLAERSRQTREYLRRAELHLNEIKLLLVGSDPNATNQKS
jgi:hypothetical protein